LHYSASRGKNYNYKSKSGITRTQTTRISKAEEITIILITTETQHEKINNRPKSNYN